jgi:hypothetical protein
VSLRGSTVSEWNSIPSSETILSTNEAASIDQRRGAVLVVSVDVDKGPRLSIEDLGDVAEIAVAGSHVEGLLQCGALLVVGELVIGGNSVDVVVCLATMMLGLSSEHLHETRVAVRDAFGHVLIIVGVVEAEIVEMERLCDYWCCEELRLALPAIVELGLGSQFGGHIAAVVERPGQVWRQFARLLGRLVLQRLVGKAPAIRIPEIHCAGLPKVACDSLLGSAALSDKCRVVVAVREAGTIT